MRRCQAQRGAALILVLAVLSVLSVIAIEGLRMAQVETMAASAARQRMQAEELLDSGLKLAMVLLGEDTSAYDYPSEPWAVYFSGAAEEAMKAAGMESSRVVSFTSGELKGFVTPDNARLPINYIAKAPVRQAFIRLLEAAPFGLEQEKAVALADAVRDWIDTDQEGQYEAAAYQGAERAYGPRNKPLEAIGDLRLVLGMSPELINGADGKPGLKDFLTAGTDEKVNLNFAPREVLAALAPADMSADAALSQAAAIMAFRADAANAELLKEPNWYKTHLRVAGEPKLADALLTISSQEFLVDLTCTVGGVRRSVHALLKRERSPLQSQGQGAGGQASQGAPAKVTTLWRELR